MCYTLYNSYNHYYKLALIKYRTCGRLSHPRPPHRCITHRKEIFSSAIFLRQDEPRQRRIISLCITWTG